MNTNNQTGLSADSVSQMIENDILTCKALITLLEEEKEALHEKDHEQLSGILDKKSVELIKLEQSAQQRSAMAKAFSNDQTIEDTWDDLIAKLNQGSLKTRWLELKKLIHECKEKNEINGKIVSRSQQVFGRLISILRGQQHSAGLYTANGSTSKGGNSIEVGQA